MICVLSIIESYSIEKNGSNFSHFLTVSLTAEYPFFYVFPYLILFRWGVVWVRGLTEPSLVGSPPHQLLPEVLVKGIFWAKAGQQKSMLTLTRHFSAVCLVFPCSGQVRWARRWADVVHFEAWSDFGSSITRTDFVGQRSECRLSYYGFRSKKMNIWHCKEA